MGMHCYRDPMTGIMTRSANRGSWLLDNNVRPTSDPGLWEKKTGLPKPEKPGPATPWITGKALSSASASLYPPSFSSYGRALPRMESPSEIDVKSKYEEAQLQRMKYWRTTATPMLKMSH